MYQVNQEIKIKGEDLFISKIDHGLIIVEYKSKEGFFVISETALAKLQD